jgi:hypothetical protein
MKLKTAIGIGLLTCGVASASLLGPWYAASRASSAAAPYVPPGFARSVYWFKFDAAASGGKYTDYSAAGVNKCTPASGGNAPTYRSDIAGGSLYFDGNDYAAGDNTPWYVSGYQTNLTINVWAQYHIQNNLSILATFNCSAGGRWSIGQSQPTATKLNCQPERPPTTYYQPSGNINTSTWYMITMSMTFTPGTGFTTKFYTNGILYATTPNQAAVPDYQSAALSIGRPTGYDGYYHKGYLGELYMTQYAWSSNEVWEVFTNQKSAY